MASVSVLWLEFEMSLPTNSWAEALAADGLWGSDWVMRVLTFLDQSTEETIIEWLCWELMGQEQGPPKGVVIRLYLATPLGPQPLFFWFFPVSLLSGCH